MNNILGLVFAILLGGAGLVVLLALVEELFPGFVGRSASLAEEQHGRAVLLGFLNSLLLLVLASVLMIIGERIFSPLFALMAGAIAILLTIGFLFGLSAMGSLIGRIIKPSTEGWSQLLWGNGAMLLACLGPYLGWFLFLPYVLFRGLGGVVMAQSAKRRERRALKEAEEEEHA